MVRRSFATPLVLTAAVLAAACEDPGSVAPDLLLEPQLAIPSGPYTPGQSYFGRNGYIEYVAGNTPVILSAPHGGALEPSEIPDRTSGACGGSATTTTDLNTIDLTLRVRDAFVQRFGTYPHVILNHLDRSKLDANRTLAEGACGDPEAEIAWNEFQDFIDVAKQDVLATEGKGWYMDMHGHGHEIQRLELGYLIRGSQLDQSDATLDGTVAYQDTSSIKTMSEDAGGTTFAGLLRGATSLGTLYDDQGFRSIPSSSDPGPQGNSYFRGGYNTVRHTCTVRASEQGGSPGGNICGVQVEANYSGVRDNATNRQAFGDATAVVLEQYLATHWGIALGGGNVPPSASFTENCSDLSCDFTDTSGDADGSVVAWSWDFGDGNGSTQQHPTHAFSSEGTYSVSLTVTDDGGSQDTATHDVTVTPPPPPISLQVDGYKVKGVKHADLTWSGATSSDVDVHRDGQVVATTANDGFHTDDTGQKGGASHTYQVCEAGTNVCSAEITVF